MPHRVASKQSATASSSTGVIFNPGINSVPAALGVEMNNSYSQTKVLGRLTQGQGLGPAHADWVSRRLTREWRAGFKAKLGRRCLHDRGHLHTEVGDGTGIDAGTPQHGADDIVIAFFDDRPNPNLETMARLVDAIREVSAGGHGVAFHALLERPVDGLPRGVRITALSGLPAHVRCVQRGLARFVTTDFSGRRMAGVLHKVLIHWILPSDIGRIVMLDSDIIPLRSVSALRDEFVRMRHAGALFGLSAEQSSFYASGDNMPPGVPGYNTGVWLMDLDAMRKSSWYTWLLDAYQAGALFRHLGMVPDQNFVNGVAGLSPSLIHTIGCGWNRQLGSWKLAPRGVLHAVHFPPRHANATLTCSQPCAILHFNGNLKCHVKPLLAAAGSCTAWHALIRAIPTTPDQQVRNKSECVLRRQFGGVRTGINGDRGARAASAAYQIWGDCCRGHS